MMQNLINYIRGKLPWKDQFNMSTPSADFVSGYESGYSDAKAGKAAAYTAPPPAPVPAPAVISVGPADDIQKIMSALKGGETIKLTAARSIPTPLTSSAAYTLDGGNFPVTFVPAPSSSSLFLISHAGTTIENLNAVASAATANSVLFVVYADKFTAANSTATAGFGKIGETCANGTNATFTAIKSGVTNSNTYYLTQDGTTVQNSTVAGSVGETPIRIDVVATGAAHPKNVTITGNTVDSVGGTNAKGTMEWREAGTGCIVSDNLLYDYVRSGQDWQTGQPAFTPGCTVAGLAITDNTFATVPAIGEHLMIKGGSNVTVTGNSFLVDAKVQVAAIDAQTEVVFSKNVRHPNAAGIIPKPAFYDKASTSPLAKITDDGGTLTQFGA